LTQIHEEPQKQLCSISQDTEDALDPLSLAVLAQGHDRQTSEAARRILLNRLTHDPDEVNALMRDVCSPDPQTFGRARLLLKLIERESTDTKPIHFLLEIMEKREDAAQENANSARQARDHEESFEEQELRRRRREAVVFHDGGGPVTQDDIIQRGRHGGLHVTQMNEVEQNGVERILRDLTLGTG